jgi:hypothetical protein
MEFASPPPRYDLAATDALSEAGNFDMYMYTRETNGSVSKMLAVIDIQTPERNARFPGHEYGEELAGRSDQSR